MAKRSVQEINAGSMADIAFLLLIFFLVSTTMDVDSGIQRMLPPISDAKQDDTKINERNILQVSVSAGGNLGLKQNGVIHPINLIELKDRTKEFILNSENRPDMPEKQEVEIDLLGNVLVSKGVISIKNDRETSYDMYIKVQNEVTRALNEIRNSFSMERFGKKFADLADDQRAAVLKAVPTAISEADPVDVTNKGRK